MKHITYKCENQSCSSCTTDIEKSNWIHLLCADSHDDFSINIRKGSKQIPLFDEGSDDKHWCTYACFTNWLKSQFGDI